MASMYPQASVRLNPLGNSLAREVKNLNVHVARNTLGFKGLDIPWEVAESRVADARIS
jgi:hypothetical protein